MSENDVRYWVILLLLISLVITSNIESCGARQEFIELKNICGEKHD